MTLSMLRAARREDLSLGLRVGQDVPALPNRQDILQVLLKPMKWAIQDIF